MSFWDQDTEEGGGGIESFSGTISNAFFQPGEYSVSLCLVAMFDQPELFPNKEDGTYTMYFGCGSGWKTEDGGDSIVHESGDSKAFRKDSDAGRLFDQLKTVPGLRDAAPDFNPYVAKSYQGLSFEFGRVPYVKRVPATDEAGQVIRGADGKPTDWVDKTVNLMMPVALKGGTVEAAPVDISDLDLTSEQVAALGAAKTDSDFMKVLMEEGLTGNPKVMGLVSSNLAGFKAALPF